MPPPIRANRRHDNPHCDMHFISFLSLRETFRKWSFNRTLTTHRHRHRQQQQRSYTFPNLSNHTVCHIIVPDTVYDEGDAMSTFIEQLGPQCLLDERFACYY